MGHEIKLSFAILFTSEFGIWEVLTIESACHCTMHRIRIGISLEKSFHF